MNNFVVLCAARTGSTLLVELLNRSPDIKCHYELLNPKVRQFGLGPGAPRKAEIEAELEALRQSDVDGFLAAMRARDAKPNFGFKLFKGHHHEFEDRVVADRQWKKIVLYRSNILSVYSSQLVSRITGKWSETGQSKPVGSTEEPVAASPKVVFEAEEFDRFCKQFQAPYKRWLAALHESQQEFHFMEYTQIGSLPLIGALTSYLGARHPPDLMARISKTNTSVTIDRFENKDEVMAYLQRAGRLDWAAESFLGL